MIGAFLALPRPVRAAIIGVALFAAFVIAFTFWRSMDRRDAVNEAIAEVEAKAAPAREAAEAIPDSRPDDRELRRRCRQLCDSGRTPAACAGFAGPA